MYKVLIADDEQAVRIGMRNFIDWNENGFELVGEAKDGLVALELVEQTEPDIVITDLKMPELDGVELIKTLKSKGFKGKILVLSNYNEFDLVRNAMKSGASDYLLKVTMEPTELLAVLKQLCTKIKSERVELEENNKIKLELSRSREIEIKQFFAEIINGSVSENGCNVRAKDYDIATNDNEKQLFYLIIDGFDEAVNSGKIKDINRCSTALVTSIEETLSTSSVYVIDLDHREFAVLFLNLTGLNIPDLIRRIQNTISLYLNLSVTVAVCNPFKNISEIKERFDCCKTACEYRFYLGYGSIIYEDKVHINQDITYLEQENYIIKIKQFIEANNQKSAMESFDKIIADAKEKGVKPTLLKNTINIIINDIFSLLIRFAIKDIIDLDQYKKSLEQSETIAQFHKNLSALLEIFCIRLQQLKYGVYKKPIGKVIKIIDKHITDKIYLGDIAKEVGMSEGYLCKLFKSETGKPLVQYMNEIKMKRAAELLKNPEVMVKEVSSAVGIDDPFYFNKIFKKYFGVSPTEFKKTHV